MPITRSHKIPVMSGSKRQFIVCLTVLNVVAVIVLVVVVGWIVSIEVRLKQQMTTSDGRLREQFEANTTSVNDLQKRLETIENNERDKNAELEKKIDENSDKIAACERQIDSNSDRITTLESSSPGLSPSLWVIAVSASLTLVRWASY